MHPTMEVNTSKCSFHNGKSSNFPLNLGTDCFRLPNSREPTSALWLSTLLLVPLMGKHTASPRATGTHPPYLPSTGSGSDPFSSNTKRNLTKRRYLRSVSSKICSPIVHRLDVTVPGRSRRSRSYFLSCTSRLRKSDRSSIVDAPPAGGPLLSTIRQLARTTR